VPAVVGLHDASRRIAPGQLVVIDGAASEVILEPTDEVSRAWRVTPTSSTVDRRRSPTAARNDRDGVRIKLDANIEFPTI